eukprot:14150418-Alexandrium_andersonii.AAC.1
MPGATSHKASSTYERTVLLAHLPSTRANSAEAPNLAHHLAPDRRALCPVGGRCAAPTTKAHARATASLDAAWPAQVGKSSACLLYTSPSPRD